MLPIKSINYVLFGLFLLFSGSFSFASDKAVELYDLDDLDDFAVSVAAVMTPAVVQAMTTQGVPPDIVDTARSIADESFSAESLQSLIREVMMAELSEDDLDYILVWRKTALGDQINLAENQHKDPNYSERLRHYSVSDELYSVSDERRLMISDLYGDMQAIEQSVQMIINANYAMALATAIAEGEDVPEDDTMREVYDNIAAARDQIEIGVRGRMLVTGLYAYREISDGDLKKYVDFNRTDAGSQYNKVLFKVVDKWLFDSTKRFGYYFGKALRDLSEQKET